MQGTRGRRKGKKNHKQLIADRFAVFLRDGYPMDTQTERGDEGVERDQKRVFNNCAIYRKEIVGTASW